MLVKKLFLKYVQLYSMLSTYEKCIFMFIINFSPTTVQEIKIPISYLTESFAPYFKSDRTFISYHIKACSHYLHDHNRATIGQE